MARTPPEIPFRPQDIGGALTLRRPWAYAIICLPEGRRKDVENRDWRPRHPHQWLGSWLLIHAGMSQDIEAPDLIEAISGTELKTVRYGPGLQWAHYEGEPPGHIIGAARLSDFVEDSESPWFTGEWGWVFDKVVRFPNPVPARGHLSIWQPEPGTLRDCLEQLNAARE